MKPGAVAEVKAPKTVGPNLAELTIRERAAAAWASQKAEERHKAERAAKNLVTEIFGNVAVAFDDFVPDEFAKRHEFEPRHLVTFAIEGLEFNYRAAHEKRPAVLTLIDMCKCGRGPRLLADIRSLASLGWAHELTYQDVKCLSCKKDEKA